MLRGQGGVILDVHEREVTDSTGLPVKHWNHPLAVSTGETEENPAARRYGGLRVFTPDDLVVWGHPNQGPTGSTRREYRRRAVEALERLIQDSAVRAQEVPASDGTRIGWRLFRPPHLQTR